MNIQEMLAPLTAEGIGMTLLCGFIIGLERQLSGKPVGIRTCCLICLGTYTFIISGQIIQSTTGDPTRIIGQLITGIGFIGAGVILSRGGVVIGITSASVIWILAGIGILIAFEKYHAAFILSVIVVIILKGVAVLEHFFAFFGKGIYSKFSKHKIDSKGG
ncbi:MgtC/SapB family protein [Candidatus Latescibacterota bacterium]